MTKLVPAMCTQCGATVKVDSSNDAAICECCGMPFVIDKAINNYNYHVKNIENVDNLNVKGSVINMGPGAENLAKRGHIFLKEGNLFKAQEYFDRALDIDCENKLANEGMKEIEQIYEDRRREEQRKQELRETIPFIIGLTIFLIVFVVKVLQYAFRQL